MSTPAVPVLITVSGSMTQRPLPAPAHPGDAGIDLRAAAPHTIAPGHRVTIGTGVAMALPHGYAAYVLPRSGLAARHGITVLNAPGTIDAGYRGEISVTLLNTDSMEPFSVAVGDRIAQLVLQPVHPIAFTQVQHLPGSARGAQGFGSTGGFGPAEPMNEEPKNEKPVNDASSDVTTNQIKD
ncbi:MAG: dUTP diphosphatase [Ornithinimicrobium sp.]